MSNQAPPLLTQLAAALTTGEIRVIDLTQTLTPEFPQIALPPEAVCRTRDGGYAMASSFSFNANGYGLSVLKMDLLGEIDWHTTVEAHEEVSFEGVIEQTADDGFIITNQAAVTKLSPTGGRQWQRTPPQMFQYYNGVIETADGFLVVGMLGGSTTRGVMTKFDFNGTDQWEKLFSDTEEVTVSSCNKIVKASDKEPKLGAS